MGVLWGFITWIHLAISSNGMQHRLTVLWIMWIALSVPASRPQGTTVVSILDEPVQLFEQLVNVNLVNPCAVFE